MTGSPSNRCLQLGGGASHSTILNGDSYYNADSTPENADGFAAKLDVGTGNKFIDCRAWQNLDDAGMVINVRLMTLQRPLNAGPLKVAT